MISQTHKLDVVPGGVTAVVHVKQYQTGESLVFELFSRFGDFEISAAYTECTVRGTKSDGNGYSANATCDPSNNSVTVELTEQMTAVAGRQPYEITITESTGRMITTTFILDVHRAALDADTVESESVIREVDAAVEDYMNEHGLDYVNYPGYPDSKYGTAGQSLRTKGDGTTEWADVGLPTDEQTQEAVNAWLDEHPEATTTIQDGAVTVSKIADSAVTTAKVADGAITSEKLSDDVKYEYQRGLTIKDLKGKAIAHRGYGWNYDGFALPLVAQQTIKAFQIAADNGFECIEIDVQKDVNDIICCFHDSNVSNVTTGTGLFKSADYSTLLYVDAYGTQTAEGVITFERACQWAASNNIILEVEIKTGSDYKAATIGEVLSIADKVQAKVFINCHSDSALLADCQANYPNVWKNTNSYKDVEITNTLVDQLVAAGYTNLCIYIWPTNVTTADETKYAYDHGFLIIRKVASYSANNQHKFGMTFSDSDRPNYLSPLVYDSGWITVDTLHNDYTAVSGYEVQYRRVNDMVSVQGILKKTTWEAIPTNSATTRKAFTLPVHFRPGYAFRTMQQIGDKFIGFHTVHISYNYGDVIPCFRVNTDLTLNDLNSNTYYLFFTFPVEMGT